MRIRTNHGTVRWSPSVEDAVLVTHHLFAGEYLHTRQGLALLLPPAQLRLKPFQDSRIDQWQPTDTSLAVVRVDMDVPAVREVHEVGRTVLVHAICAQEPEDLHGLLARHFRLEHELVQLFWAAPR